MKRLLTIATIATFALVSVYGCKKSKPDTTLPAEKNDCKTYQAKSSSGSKNGVWSAPNEVDDYPGLLPAVTDPAGGYYIVTFSCEASTAWIDISVPGDSYPIINGSSAGSSTPQTRKVAFLAHPGVSYDVSVNPFHNGPSFPEAYTISWEYVGLMDCFENNDEFANAKYVPKNEILEAFANAGLKNVGPPENRYDWYKVVVGVTSKIKVDILQSPSDEFMGVAIYRADNSQLTVDRTDVSGNSGSHQPGTLYSTTTKNTVNPGTYYVRIEADNAADNRVVDFNDGESMPDAWKTPYKFKVTTI